jgi:SAM-dependent methyltransferase
MSDSMNIFDRPAVRRHRTRAAATVPAIAPILQDVADRLLDRLDDTKHRFARALDVGGRGITAPMLRARGIEVVATDLSPEMAARSAPLAVAADEEHLPFAPASFDLVVANLSLHWVNDLPGALIQLRMALKPDGLFLASLPILGTLAELRTALTTAEAMVSGGAAPRISPFPELRDAAGLLQRAGFALPVADADEITLSYGNPFALLQDLRAAGEANAVRLRDKRTPPRALFPAALASLPQQAGRHPATLRLAMLTGWSPAPSQPKPLPRGSGQVPLGSVLGS